MGIGRWRNDKPVGKRLCGELGAGAFCWLSVGDSDKGSAIVRSLASAL